ncbi:MAG: hypothetical protein JNJ46_23710 [Myxococcales bacterium]|nr:hypothetical protein [Myxococcales bacterium]
MTTQNPKRPAQNGDLVKFEVSAKLLSVSGDLRRLLRPTDTHTEGEQLYLDEEEIVIGSPEADPIFNLKLTGAKAGEVKAFKVQYPDYERENIMVVPLQILLDSKVPRDAITVGFVLNRDVLKGKIAIDGHAIELGIIEISEKDGIEYVMLDTHERTRGLTIEYRVKVISVKTASSAERRVWHLT